MTVYCTKYALEVREIVTVVTACNFFFLPAIWTSDSFSVPRTSEPLVDYRMNTRSLLVVLVAWSNYLQPIKSSRSCSVVTRGVLIGRCWYWISGRDGWMDRSIGRNGWEGVVHDAV